MRFLINASNIHAGGGIQVVDSFCSMLGDFTNHSFVVVLSSFFTKTKKRIENINNVHVIVYDIEKNLNAIIGRNRYLDDIVSNYNIQAVLTVFGPSYWRPQCPHLCGMARPHLVLPDSPFFNNVSLKDKAKYKIWELFFKQCSNIFYTENPFISKRLRELFNNKKIVYTVTNYYHQIYDNPKEWDNSIDLPPFQGVSILTISSANAHKNFPIIVGIIDYFKRNNPDFSFRFVLTQRRDECPFVSEDLVPYFVFLGTVDVHCCPHLYSQCDIMFQPSLLECFSATYPEAMRMEVPIVTTNLEFAVGLCEDAACYYSAIDPESAAKAIFKVANDKEYSKQLVKNGKKQLLKYDDYTRRADKLISILESNAD